ncbi:metal-sensitive transcriptional regulator [Kocuria sp. M1R5S2]|uniref:metal-sensitive transcriptional regulator n=1 Tax=Kocuria rhizosphaerae TaxID=3376285 RepID=UPI0037AA4413
MPHNLPPHGYTAEKDAWLKRLRRIEGQVRGVHRMVEEDQYCIDVLTQISAIQSALKAVSLGLLDEHLNHCVVGAIEAAQESGDTTQVDDKLQEASAAIARLLKS